MNLFEYNLESNQKNKPLAVRMRPTSLEEFVGQSHIIGKDKLLYRAIQADRLSSIILYGASGTGKTTLAQIIANTTKSEFFKQNATTANSKDIKDIISSAINRKQLYNKNTILFLDEIHRFNKSQQDILLPFVEDKTITLIGATTENPYFEINSALLSRSHLFQFQPLTPNDIQAVLSRALRDFEKGLGSHKAILSKEASLFLAKRSKGDCRIALNTLELATLTTDPSDDGNIHITIDIIADCLQQKPLSYDKNQDNHYDTISAFIKSMRGSDPDATLYYLARMISAGEDIKFIARRILISASEDVGNADPHALQVAVSAMQAVQFVGMPEGRIILAQAASYVACAPKSNACCIGIDEALKDVDSIPIKEIPPHLKDCHYAGASQLGNGIGYQYPHDFPNHYIHQTYLPKELQHKTYYHISDNGIEKRIKAHLDRLKAEATKT